MTKNLAVDKVCKAAESVAEVVQNTQLQIAFNFPSQIYVIERNDFLDEVSIVSEEFIKIEKEKRNLNDIYPLYQSENYFADPRMDRFAGFVGATAWNILNEQGYAMQDKAMSFMEMWTQEHTD